MFRYFSLAFKNVFRNKRRSVLTISSIAVSLCLFGVLIAMYHALFLSQPTPGQALRLVIRHKVSLAQVIPFADEAKVRALPGVKEISVWNWFGGTYKNNREAKNFFARFGVEPAPFLTIRTDMKMPDDQRKAFVTDRTGCIISKDLAKNLDLKLGDRVVLKGDIYPYDLNMKIVGIFDDPDATTSRIALKILPKLPKPWMPCSPNRPIPPKPNRRDNSLCRSSRSSAISSCSC